MDFKTKRTTASGELKRPTGVLADPGFKRWFGQSKVLDSKGDPLVVHRGTDNPSRPLAGSWWSESVTAAKEYGPVTLSAYLRLRNPATDKELDGLLGKYLENTDGRDLAKYEDGELYPARDQAAFVEGFQRFVIDHGFDGLMVMDDSHSSHPAMSYVPFESEQVRAIQTPAAASISTRTISKDDSDGL